MFNNIFDMYNFIIKERKDWSIYAVSAPLFLWIMYIAMVLIFIAFIYSESESYFEDTSEYLIEFFFIATFAWYGVYTLILRAKARKAKNLKHNWMWIVKKLKVNEIVKARVASGKGSNFNVTCVRVIDGEKAYYSAAHKKWKIDGVSQSDLEKIYNAYGFVYDEKQSQQKDLLNFLDGEISKIDYEIQNSSLFKRLKLNRDLVKLTKEKQTIETWYIPQYWEVNWNKVSVWDSVDVYIDPNNPDIYWVDIDFLFD